MALINCPECNKEISDRVTSWPHCGYPMCENSNEQKIQLETKNLSTKNTKKIFIFVAVIILGIIIFKVLNNEIKNSNDYKSAVILFDDKKYNEAEIAFLKLGSYKDSVEKVKESKDAYTNMYVENFEFVAAKIYLETLLAELKCAYISETWSNAINSRAKKDFSNEIAKLITEWDEKGLIQEATESKEMIDIQMKSIQNPVPEYEEAYTLLLDMYGLYIQIYKQSLEPTGSLLTYNSTLKNMYSDFDKVYNQLIIIKPEIKERILNQENGKQEQIDDIPKFEELSGVEPSQKEVSTYYEEYYYDYVASESFIEPYKNLLAQYGFKYYEVENSEVLNYVNGDRTVALGILPQSSDPDFFIISISIK